MPIRLPPWSGEGADGVVEVVRPGAREVPGDDRVLDVERRAGGPRPEDPAAGGGEVGVDGVVRSDRLPVKASAAASMPPP